MEVRDPHTVALVDEQGRRSGRLEGEVIVIATGSRPNRPADAVRRRDRLRLATHSLATAHAAPDGGARRGVIGIEYASIFAASA